MPKQPLLHGPRVTLRPITEADAAAMFAGLADEESRRLTGTHADFTLEQVKAHCRRIVQAEDRADYAITLRGDPAYRGEAVLNDIDWNNRSASFRIALVERSLFGRGYGSEATHLIVAYGLRILQLHRIELEVYDFNPRALRVYEKVGFVREGVRREALLWEGAYHDAIVMSILDREYAGDALQRVT